VGTYPYNNVTGLVTDIVRPSGETLTFSYQSGNICIRSKPGGGGYICTQRQVIRRAEKVVNSAGEQLNFAYLYDLDHYTDPDFVPYEPYDDFWNEWGNIIGVSAPGGGQSMGPSTVGTTTWFTVTNALGQVAKYRMAGGRIVGITRTGGTSEDVAIAYNGAGKVSGVTTPDGTTGYAYADAGGVRTVTVTNPLSQAATYRFDIASNRLSSVTDALSRTTTYKYDADGRVTHVVAPEGTLASGTPTAGYTKFTYDARGNLTSDGTRAYSYTAENLLKTGPGGFLAGYDPVGRLRWTATPSTGSNYFLYDGASVIAEWDRWGTTIHRYVHGPGIDNPIVWYEGSTIDSTTRRFLMSDERGSIVSVTDSTGATLHINAYDEYGIPAPGNMGQFGYTGQAWLPEIGMWYYKARIYSPTLGRFFADRPHRICRWDELV
jgi:YD repeat-containing protein